MSVYLPGVPGGVLPVFSDEHLRTRGRSSSSSSSSSLWKGAGSQSEVSKVTDTSVTSTYGGGASSIWLGELCEGGRESHWDEDAEGVAEICQRKRQLLVIFTIFWRFNVNQPASGPRDSRKTRPRPLCRLLTRPTGLDRSRKGAGPRQAACAAPSRSVAGTRGCPATRETPRPRRQCAGRREKAWDQGFPWGIWIEPLKWF